MLLSLGIDAVQCRFSLLTFSDLDFNENKLKYNQHEYYKAT